MTVSFVVTVRRSPGRRSVGADDTDAARRR